MYTNLVPISYNFAGVDLGAGAFAREINGPAGCIGRVVDVHIAASETFTDTTTSATLKVGTATDDNAYVDLDLGTTAAGDALSASNQSGALIANARIPADTAVKVAGAAPTGGTPAGIADIAVVIAWEMVL